MTTPLTTDIRASGLPRLKIGVAPGYDTCSGGVALIEPGADSAEVPGQQFMDALDRMFGNTCQHLAEVMLGVEAVRARRFGQQVDDCRALATGIRKGLIMPWFRRQKSRSGIRSIP